MLTTETRKRETKEIEDEIDREMAEVYGGEGVEQVRFRSKWYVAGLRPFRKISFECPGCSRWLSVNSAHSGRSGFCPSCDLTVCAPDIAEDLPAALVSTAKQVPATPAHELPEQQVWEARPANDPRQDARFERTPELERPGKVENDEDHWGIRDDNSLVPVYVVTRYQSIKPWLGIATVLVCALFAGRMFLSAQGNGAASAAAAEVEKPQPKRPQIGSDMWVVLDSLATAKTPEEMASLVRNPEEMLPKMQTFYKNNASLVSLPHKFERTSPRTVGYEINGRTFVRFEGRCDGRPVKFAFEQTQYGWRLDWESLIGYSQMPWSGFLEDRPQGDHEFRVLAKVTTDGVLEYDRQQYLCLHLVDHLGTGNGFALLDRHGLAAAKIGKFLQLYDRGQQPTTWITPILKVHEGSDELLEVVDFKSGSWLIP